MNRPLQKAVYRLADTLADAARAGDWQAVRELDAQVNRFLGSRQTMPAELRPALAQLKQAHALALDLARAEASRLSDRIGHLRDNREGLRAYEQSRGMNDFL